MHDSDDLEFFSIHPLVYFGMLCSPFSTRYLFREDAKDSVLELVIDVSRIQFETFRKLDELTHCESSRIQMYPRHRPRCTLRRWLCGGP